MATTFGLKKKVLVCLLAAAMGASALAGGVMLDARAEGVSITSLVTVTGDAAVEAVPRQYQLKDPPKGADGQEGNASVGDTGLYVAATELDSPEGYSVALNGVFTGSVGMKVSFPGEGFWKGDHHPYREAVMTVTSVSDPTESFELHLEGEYGMNAHVSFDYGAQREQTLIRARSRYNTENYVQDGYENDDQEWSYTKITENYFNPTMGCFETEGNAADPRREACYIGLEMKDDGTLNVVLMTNTDWAEPYKKIIASFAEDPSSFTPSSATEGDSPNLPRLESFKDGYTIRFDVSDTDGGNACDFLLASIATSQTGDPYDEQSNGEVCTFDQETLEAEPSFYTNWQETSVFSTEGYAYLNSAVRGQEIDLIPALTVTKAGKDAGAFTGTVTVTDPDSVKTPVTGGKFTAQKSGKHVVSYSGGGLPSGKELRITFYVNEKANAVGNIIENLQGAEVLYEKDARKLTGVTLRGTQGGFSGEFAGSFAGDMNIDFSLPQVFHSKNTGNGAKVTFTVYDMDGNKAFDIVYLNAGGWYTAAYVQMGKNIIRTHIADGSYDGWDPDKTTMFYTIPSGDRSCILPGAGIMYTEDGQYGSLQLKWEGNVLCVNVTSRPTETEQHPIQTIAKFDGSKPYTNELDYNGAIILENDETPRYGLPLMDGSDEAGVDLTNGFRIGFSSNNQELPVTFLSVNGIDLPAGGVLESEAASSVKVLADQAYVNGNDIYVAQGLHAGTVRSVWSTAFKTEDGAYTGSWGTAQQITVQDIAELCTQTSVGEHSFTVSAPSGWSGQDKQFTLHIETAYKLSFDLGGGKAQAGYSAEQITFSEHTRFLLSVPEVEKAAWAFENWYTNAARNVLWDGSFETWNTDMTLYAKWEDVTPATVTLADGVEKYTEVLVQDGSFVISRADVIADDAAQPERVTLTVQYRQGTGGWQTLSGTSETITGLTPSKWEIKYTATDGTNGNVEFIRTIVVIERTAPVVTVGEVVSESYLGFAVTVSNVTATDFDGATLNVNVTVVDENGTPYPVQGGAFTPDKAGVYTVSYTATDGKELTGYASRKVTVIADEEVPVLNVDFANTTIEKGSTVTLPAATATDNAYAEIAITVTVSYGTQQVALSENNTFQAEKEGVYTITWTAEDGAGNTVVKTALVTVTPAAPASVNVGLIVGISVGAVVVAAAIAVAVVLIVRKKKKANAGAGAEDAPQASEQSNQEE